MRDIFWIEGQPPARLAIVLRPQGEDRLQDEMRRIRGGGISTLVSLLEPEEARWLGLAEEASSAQRAGIEFLSHPIPDAHVPPDRVRFRCFVSELADRLRAGDPLGVHCRGSIGRSTVAAACALIHLGWQPSAALKAIEKARGCVVPQTLEQCIWILNYKAQQ